MHRATAACLLSLALLPQASWSQPNPGPAAGDAHAPPREDRDYAFGERGEKIREFIKSLDMQGFSGSILAARKGDVVAAVGVGKADAAADKANTPASLFEIASLTKQFTAAAIVRLAQDGRLGLDDPIAKHLPGVPADCAAIAIRHLLQHTSGIPGANSQGAGRDLAAVLPLFLKGGPQHTPGEHWEYWNQGYALLAEIVTRASGKDYPDYCRDTLFRPAGLASTCFTGDAAPAGSSVTTGISTRGPSRSALAHPYGEYGFQYRGMGGVVTSVWDLWRWDRALQTDTPLSASSRDALFKPGPGKYALGWFVAKADGGRLVQSHGGGVRGFCCEMRRFPEEDACVIVLANRDDAPVKRVADAIEQLLFGEPLTWQPAPAQLDAKTRSSLVGRFTAAGGRLLLIDDEAGVLQARIEWGAGGPTTRGTIGSNAAQSLVFNDGHDSIPMVLERDPDGRVSTIGMLDKLLFSREQK